jgi:hypothetical protein
MHTEEEALGTRLVMDTLSCIIEKEADPSKLIAMSPGARRRRIVAYLPSLGFAIARLPGFACTVMG